MGGAEKIDIGVFQCKINAVEGRREKRKSVYWKRCSVWNLGARENAEMFAGVLCFFGVVYPFFPGFSPLFLPPLFPPPPPFFFSSIPNPVPTPLAPFLHGASFLPALSNSPALPCQVDSAKYRKYSCRGNRGKTPPRGLSGAAPPLQLQPPPPPTPRRYFHYSSNITSPPLSPHTHAHTQTSFPLWHNAGAAAQPPPPSPAL